MDRTKFLYIMIACVASRKGSSGVCLPGLGVIRRFLAGKTTPPDLRVPLGI